MAPHTRCDLPLLPAVGALVGECRTRVPRRATRSAFAATIILATSLSLGACSSTSETSGDSSSAASATTSSADLATSAASQIETTASSSAVLRAAAAFEATLTAEPLTALHQEYTFENAQNWSNFPDALLAGGGMGGGMGGPAGGTSVSTAIETTTQTGISATGMGASNSTGRIRLQTSELNDEQWAALATLIKVQQVPPQMRALMK